MGMEDQSTPTVTEPTAGAPTPVDPYVDFSAVFDGLMERGDNSETPTDQTGAPDSAGSVTDNAQQPAKQADGVDDSAQPPAAGDNPAAPNGAGPQDDKGGEPAGGKPQHTDNVTDPTASKLAELQEQIRVLTEKATSLSSQQAAEPAPAADTPAPIFTAEEQTELATLQKEWPDLARMFSLMSRQVQHDTLTYAFKEVERVLTPLQSSVGTLTGNEHMAAIYEAHADYDQVYQPVMDWIQQQPSFLKAAYTNVVKQGTAQDVADMIARFKTETKWQSPAAPTAQAPAATPAAATPTQKPAELSEAAKKAATAIGAVGTKRSGGMTADDPLDFDGTWDSITATK